ncbi:MAG: hypothetical protein ACRCYO_19170 [Bacteroidia bacterium]
MKKTFLPLTVGISAAALFCSLTSCSNDTAGNNTGDSVNNDSLAVVDSAVEQNVQVPSPAEMFAFMKLANTGDVKSDQLNSPDNEKNYNSKKAQSLNLGIYSSDLLYCSTFNVSDKVLGYFGTVMRMGNKLQVATTLNEKDKERIGKNAGNADSLVAISNDLYLSSFQNLEDNKRGTDLSLMLAGGWVESLFLMSNIVKDFDKDNKAAIRVAEQKLSLDNLVEYMTKYESNADVASVLTQMKELQTLFAAVKTNESGAGSMTMKGGKRILGGGSKTVITKDQFEKIKTKIAEIRASFIAAQ